MRPKRLKLDVKSQVRQCRYIDHERLACCFFFFQAEDGIRDDLVTAVQTCALPISAEYIIRPFLIITFPGSQIRDINQPGCGTSGSTCPPVSSAFRARLLL